MQLSKILLENSVKLDFRFLIMKDLNLLSVINFITYRTKVHGTKAFSGVKDSNYHRMLIPFFTLF